MGTVQNFLRCRFQFLRNGHNHAVEAFHLFKNLFAGVGFNAANAGGNRRLGSNAERADLRRVIQMRTAAEFQRILSHFYHADRIAVFFAKQRRSAKLSGLLDRQNEGVNLIAFEHHIHHFITNFHHFLGRNG